MSAAYAHESPRLQAALDELMALIRAHYPSATFSVEHGVDDPNAVHLVTTVDVDDPDALVDLTIERELQFQIDEGLPVHVIPRRTPARVAAMPRYEQRTSPSSQRG